MKTSDVSACPLMLLDESGDELRDELLLAPRQSNGLLEDALELADGARSPSFDRPIAQDFLDASPECTSQFRKHVGTRGRCGGFPIRDRLRRDADGVTELGLAEPGRLS